MENQAKLSRAKLVAPRVFEMRQAKAKADDEKRKNNIINGIIIAAVVLFFGALVIYQQSTRERIALLQSDDAQAPNQTDKRAQFAKGLNASLDNKTSTLSDPVFNEQDQALVLTADNIKDSDCLALANTEVIEAGTLAGFNMLVCRNRNSGEKFTRPLR